MSPSGGNHPPANPAMVSGPGQLSQRTDGGPGNEKQPIRVAPGGAYGDRKAAVEQQQMMRVPKEGGHRLGVDASPQMRQRLGLPMSDTPNQAYQGGPLNAPSGRPGEPVTHGVGVGAGAGPEALTGAAVQRTDVGPMTRLLMQMAPGGATGDVAELLRVAQLQNA